MPLPKPALDNRVFDQLVAEARGQIPRLAPAWTDHNASDPGITLIELAAWLAEQNIYRFDRPSDEALRDFARLVLDSEPFGAVAARTVVGLVNANAQVVDLPPRIQLSTSLASFGAGSECFETCEAATVSTATLERVVPATAAQAGLSPMTLPDLSAANDACTVWAPFGSAPRVGAALCLGFDQPLDLVGRTLSLHFWTDAWRDDIETAARLQAETARQLERLKAVCSCCEWKARERELDWRLHYRVRTVWEYVAGGIWLPFEHVVDETRALSLSGFVRFRAPVGHTAIGGRYFIRCRVAQGRYECPPRLRHVAFNAVLAEAALSRAERALGVSVGHAHQRFAFSKPDGTPDTPVLVEATRLRVDDGIAPPQADWSAHAAWDLSGPRAHDVIIDRERAVLTIGDGLRGEVPAAGATLYAAYRIGGGAAGNIDATSLLGVAVNAANDALTAPIPLSALAQPLTVVQPFPATGGIEPETLRAMQARAFERATRVDKAVTLADFERLALAIPGVPVARVHAIADVHPALPCYPAPGVVQVIVVPHCKLPAPMPSQALLDAVGSYLEPRRLVTSEIHVVAPTYRRVAVYATLQVDCDVNVDVVRAAAVAAVNAFLDPLTGGPDSNGWPLGRPIYRNELIALLVGVSGVGRVTDFGLNGPCGQGACCDNVTLCPTELVRPGKHLLQISSRLPPDLRRSDAHECETDRSCA